MQDAFAHCEALVRAADKDRFLATLFAPAEHRAALYALYAFNLEIARVREIVREPLAGEIRLQWWTDALAGIGAGDVGSNPVAAALLAAIARYRLPMELLTGLIEARRFDLYDDPMPRLDDLEEYGRKTSSVLIELAARILADAEAAAVGPLSHAAGLAYAIANLLVAFPLHAARGQLYVPVEVLERHGARREDVAAGRSTPELRLAVAKLAGRAREHLAQAGRLAADAGAAVMPALLPVALVGATLDRIGREDFDPFHPVEIPQWRRQWLLWRAAGRPARMFGRGGGQSAKR